MDSLMRQMLAPIFGLAPNIDTLEELKTLIDEEISKRKAVDVCAVEDVEQKQSLDGAADASVQSTPPGQT